VNIFRSRLFFAGLFLIFVMLVPQPVTSLDWKLSSVDSVGHVGTYASLALDPGGNPGISYFDSTNNRLKYSHWNGASWDTKVVDSPVNSGHTSLKFDSAGNPRISYWDVSNGHLKYAAWTGTTWSLQVADTTNFVGSYNSLALDAAGNPSVSYYGSNHLRYAHWTGSAWDIKTVDPAIFSGEHTSLKLNSSGFPRISYYDTTNRNLKYAAWDGNIWGIENVDNNVKTGTYSSLALDTSGKPCISYYDEGAHVLKYAKWNGTSWAIQNVDSSGNVGTYSSLALDRVGNPRISYYDTGNVRTKYASWNGLVWEIDVVDNAGNVGTYGSLALDNEDSPFIAYYNATSYTLKYARVVSPPKIRFAASPTTGPAPLSVTFSDVSSGNPLTRQWYFGDGSLATAQNPSHTYTIPGIYTVYLTGSNADGSNTSSLISLVTVTSPGQPVTASFTGSPVDGLPPHTVQFEEASGGLPTTWVWSFGDGGVSRDRNPQHVYPASGTYTVSLTAINGSNADTLTQPDYITVTRPGTIPVTADFTGDLPLSGIVPLTITFHDNSGGMPAQWSWSFGDGGTSSVKDPIHTYTTAGAYTVTLTAANGSVFDTTSVPGFVTVTSVTTPVVANFFNFTPRYGTMPLTVDFSDISAGPPNVWSWSFGDGEVSTDQNPTHTYTHAGIFAVSLTAVNGTHTNTLTQPGYVSVTAIPVTAVPTTAPARVLPAGSNPGDNSANDYPGTPVSTTISKTTDLYFKVNSRYLAEHRVIPVDIVVMSYSGRGWEALPTTFAYSSGNDFYFTADADTYSLLAVGNRKEGTANLPSFAPVMVSPAITPETSVRSSSSLASPNPQKVIYTEKRIPVEQKPDPIPGDMPEPKSPQGFPVTVFVGVVTVPLLVGSVYFVRRWWIRRQNPALFRKYD
jgi:PKD repeat protein